MYISLEHLLFALPIAGGVMAYFIHLESRLAKLSTDLKWMKQAVDRRKRPRA